MSEEQLKAFEGENMQSKGFVSPGPLTDKQKDEIIAAAIDLCEYSAVSDGTFCSVYPRYLAMLLERYGQWRHPRR